MGRSPHIVSLLIQIWPLGKVLNRMGRWPVIGNWLRPFFRPEDNETVVLPVGEVVQATGSVILPYIVLAPLVEGASARFILNECLCRRAENRPTCRRDIGCLFLGDGAAEIHPGLGRLGRRRGGSGARPAGPGGRIDAANCPLRL